MNEAKKPGEVPTTDEIQMRGLNGSDSQMVYESSDPSSAFAGLVITIDRWNGKGFTSIQVVGTGSGKLVAFIDRFFEHAHPDNTVRAGAKDQLCIHGKWKELEKRIATALSAWSLVHQEKARAKARLEELKTRMPRASSGHLIPTNDQLREMSKRIKDIEQ